MKFIKKHIYLLSGILGLIIIIISLIAKIKLNNNVVTAVTLESSKEEKIEKEMQYPGTIKVNRRLLTIQSWY
mgnify:CR=1 FL=1